MLLQSYSVAIKLTRIDVKGIDFLKTMMLYLNVRWGSNCEV